MISTAHDIARLARAAKSDDDAATLIRAYVEMVARIQVERAIIANNENISRLMGVFDPPQRHRGAV